MSSLFVTVGTHEQPFDRLMRAIDSLVDDDGEVHGLAVFCQYGYSTYVPRVASSAMLNASEFHEHMNNATVIVSHGGPGSIMPGLNGGHRMVLVPRQRRFGEHVDDHQVAFCQRIGAAYRIPVVEDIADLDPAILTASNAPERLTEGDDRITASLQTLSHLIAELVTSR